MSNDLNIYEGVSYNFIEIVDGFQVVYVTATRDSFNLALKCNNNWIGSVVLSGTLSVIYTDNEELSGSYATNSWIDIKPEYNNGIVCFQHGLSSSVALCKFNDTNPFLITNYEYIEGEYNLQAGISMFILSGSVSINGTLVLEKTYINSVDNDRNITCNNVHAFLINKNNVFSQN